MPCFHLNVKFLACISVLCFLISCQNNEKVDSHNFSVQVRLDKDPGKIMPMFANTTQAREVYTNVFVPMIEYDPHTLTLGPVLIERLNAPLKIEEGKYKGFYRYTFDILQEAEWKDGTPITGYDYQFAAKLVFHPEIKTAYRGMIESINRVEVNVENPKHFDVYVEEYGMLTYQIVGSLEMLQESVFDSSLVMRQYSISELKKMKQIDDNEPNKEFFQKLANDIINYQNTSKIISNTGPYDIVDISTNEYIVLKKKDNWWGDKYIDRPFLQANPKEIIYKIIPEENTAVTQLKSGDLDVMTFDNIETYNALKNNDVYQDKFAFFEPQKMATYMLLLNNRDEKLADKNVRKALAHLIDVENIINVLEDGLGVRQASFLSPYDSKYNQSLDPVMYDEEKARELLKNSGWTDSNQNGILDKQINGKLEELEFQILVTNKQLGQRIALMLQQSCEKNGIKLNAKRQDFRLSYNEEILTGNYDIVPFSISYYLGDFDPHSLWHSENASPITTNLSGYVDEKTDALIDKIRDTYSLSETKKIELYHKLQEEIYDDQPVIFLYAPQEKIAITTEMEPIISVKRPNYFVHLFKQKKGLK